MSDVLRGNGEPILEWRESQWDSSQGFVYSRQFSGHDLAKMERLANLFNFYGVGTTIRFENGRATLRTVDTTGAVTIDRWEIAVDREQPSVLENPFLQAVLFRSSDVGATTPRLRQALESREKWQDLIDDVDFGTAFTEDDLAIIHGYFDDYMLGVTNFIRDKYVLRHTTNAPNRWQANVADFNVERIYSTAQLLSEIQNPSLWVFPCPGYLVYKILAYEADAPPSYNDHYIWGALKGRSSASTTVNNRVDIATEYIIDWINTNLYALAP